GVDWVVSVATDTPFLPVDLVVRLHSAREAAGTPLAQAESGGRAHPVNALWKVSLRDELRASLAAGERKIAAWAARYGVVNVVWDTDPVDPFFNVNTPQEAAEAELLLAGQS